MIEIYFVLLLSLGAVNITHSQNNRMNSIDIGDLNIALLNDMLSRFIEDPKKDIDELRNIFYLPEETVIIKSDKEGVWICGDWEISKEDDNLSFWMDYESEFGTSDISVSIVFTPNHKGYQIVSDFIVVGTTAPVPVYISLLNLENEYNEINRFTKNLYYEIYIVDEKIKRKELESILIFLLENVEDELSISILFHIIIGKFQLSYDMLKMIFKNSTDSIRITISRHRNLDAELTEWCKGIDPLYI